MKRKRSLKSLKAELDRVFSIWIRKRGADLDGYTTCVSCGARDYYKRLQCGHFYKRQHLGTRWDERNCHTQCVQCNVFKQGNYPAFAKYLYENYPLSVMNELDALHKKPVKLTRDWLEEMIRRYSC